MTKASIALTSIKRIFLGVLISLVISCGEKPNDIKIGVLFNSASNPGQSLEMTTRLVESQLKHDPRFADETITFISKDIGSTQESALAALYELLRKNNITALVGPTTSQLTIPIAIVANARQIPLISPSASNIEVTLDKPFVFTAVFNNDLQSKALADFVVNELSASKIGVLYDKTNTYNKTLAMSFKSLVEAQNKRTYSLSYVSGETEFQSYLAKMKAAEIEVLFLPNFDRDIAKQTAAIAKLNWQPIIIGSDSWHPQNYINRPVVGETYFTHQWGLAVGLKNQQAQRFIDDFRKYHNLEPTIVSALSFDAINILLNAIHSVKGEKTKIQEYMTAIEAYQGVSGQYSYLNSNIPHKPVYLFTARQNQIDLYREIRND